MDRIKAILQDPKRKTLIANNKENEQETKGENQNTSSRQKKKQKDDELTKIVKALEGEYNRLMEELADAQKKVVSARQVKDQLNSALKEKEDAQKLVASMKADIIRKEGELVKKEQEIKSRDTDIANKYQQNERLKKDLADAQKKVVSMRQEKDTAIAQKDQQLKSALDGIAERDQDIANKNEQLDQLESIKRILNPATDDESEPAAKRTRAEDTSNKPKVKSLQLKYEHTHCSICTSKFSADLDSKDENIRKYLPVLSSSKTCDHYFCHGCVLNQQTAIAEENSGRIPKWIPCMICKMNTAFQPSEPKYHRLLIGILKQSEWVDEAPKVKEELVE